MQRVAVRSMGADAVEECLLTLFRGPDAAAQSTLQDEAALVTSPASPIRSRMLACEGWRACTSNARQQDSAAMLATVANVDFLGTGTIHQATYLLCSPNCNPSNMSEQHAHQNSTGQE